MDNHKLKIIFAVVLVLTAVFIGYYYIAEYKNSANDSGSLKLSYDLYIGGESAGHSTVKISPAVYDGINGYMLNITTIHVAGKTVKSTYLAYTSHGFEPLYVLYKDNSTTPTLPERILEVKFKDNSALAYSRYLETSSEGLSKSYSIAEVNDTIKISKETSTQMLVRFLKLKEISMKENYKGQFALVNQNMTIEVSGKETVNTPAGSFDCWVAEEILYKPAGKKEHSKVWYSTDDHIPVKIKNEETGIYQVLANYQ